MKEANKTTSIVDRGKIASLTLAPPPAQQLSLSETSKLLGIPRSTVAYVKRHILAEVDINGGTAMDNINLLPHKAPGRPKLMDEREKRRLRRTATRDRPQRLKDSQTDRVSGGALDTGGSRK